MKYFAKYIVKIIIKYLRRAWFFFKMSELETKLEDQKKEAEDASKLAKSSYDSFMHAYNEYQHSKSGDRVRPGAAEVRKDGSTSKGSSGKEG